MKQGQIFRSSPRNNWRVLVVAVQSNEDGVKDTDGGVALGEGYDEHARRSRGKMGKVTAESRAPVPYKLCT